MSTWRVKPQTVYLRSFSSLMRGDLKLEFKPRAGETHGFVLDVVAGGVIKRLHFAPDGELRSVVTLTALSGDGKL